MVEDEKGRALAGVTVVVTSETVPGSQAELTDSSGQFVVLNLPPSEYTVSFYFADLRVDSKVVIDASQRVTLRARIRTQAAREVLRMGASCMGDFGPDPSEQQGRHLPGSCIGTVPVERPIPVVALEPRDPCDDAR